MSKPPTYEVFRKHSSSTSLVVQIRHVGTGEAVSVLDLACYIAVEKIETPWYSIVIQKNSRLLLTDETAAHLLAAGSITPFPPAPLIPWWEAEAEKHAARWELTKSRRLAVQRPEARG